jgi:hypothetical protein
MLSKSAASASTSLTSFHRDAISESLSQARAVYKEAAEQLFIMCHQIQVTGQIPQPTPLTKVLARFLQAHTEVALLEDLRKSMPAAACAPEYDPPPR